MEEPKQYKYVYGIGKQPLNLSESEIRYAMENTKSNAAAAEFLKVSYTTYKKYSKMYVDRDSGKTLFELHKNQYGVGIVKNSQKASRGIYSIDAILEGKWPKYPSWKLRNRLLALGVFKEAADRQKKGQPEVPIGKKISQAPVKQTEQTEVVASPTLVRSMFPSTSTMTNVSTPTTGGQGLASISGNQFKSLFPGDTLGAAYMETKNA